MQLFLAVIVLSRWCYTVVTGSEITSSRYSVPFRYSHTHTQTHTHTHIQHCFLKQSFSQAGQNKSKVCSSKTCAIHHSLDNTIIRELHSHQEAGQYRPNTDQIQRPSN